MFPFADLPWWGHGLATLALTHVTIAAVTIYLHRHSAHRSLDLHPLASHFFRFWLWLTTGMVTREWTAVHRRHHAACETADDPHSPQILGIGRVLWLGVGLYRRAAADRETLARYGRNTPDDWIERHVYTPYNGLGLVLMAGIDLALFGPVAGLAIFALQLAWIPFWAAGVINGIGHWWGYRSHSLADASTNIVPWGILIGGEELHNNHHAHAGSARLSDKWYEFDIGWLYIRLLAWQGLARVKKVAPRLRRVRGKLCCDLETLQAVFTHRHAVLARYARAMHATCRAELRRLRRRDPQVFFRLRAFFTGRLPGDAALALAVAGSRKLDILYRMRQELTALWERSGQPREQLLRQLENWCARAETSGIEALAVFARRLRCYA
jgi:stearoyl-CoA desaturase (delta-9 desaturase)